MSYSVVAVGVHEKVILGYLKRAWGVLYNQVFCVSLLQKYDLVHDHPLCSIVYILLYTPVSVKADRQTDVASMYWSHLFW